MILRKPFKPGLARTERITAYLRPREYEAVQELAMLSGLTLSGQLEVVIRRSLPAMLRRARAGDHESEDGEGGANE